MITREMTIKSSNTTRYIECSQIITQPLDALLMFDQHLINMRLNKMCLQCSHDFISFRNRVSINVCNYHYELLHKLVQANKQQLSYD